MILENTITHEFLAHLPHDCGVLPTSLVQHALEIIGQTPVPTTRTEAWKYTRVAKLTKKTYVSKQQELPSIKPYIIDENALNLIFINGQFHPNLSSSVALDGLAIKSIKQCSKEEISKAGTNLVLENELFNAINTAYSNDGFYIEIEEGKTIEKTIQVTHISTGNLSFTNQRNLIVVNKSAKANIILSYFSENAEESFGIHVTEIFVAQNAHLHIDKIQAEETTSNQIITEQIEQASDSTFTINTITLNGGLVRNNLNIGVNGTNCETNLHAAYLLKESQHVDNHTIVDHKMPHCNSNELYKGVIDGSATAVFNGKVFVRKDAQKINAFQSNGNVLLSDDATVNSKPELEIYADDVKCSHGSTTGQLDEEAVFYLRARGISENSARQLMVGAFIGEVLEKIENEQVQNFVNGVLRDRFGWEV